MENINLAVILGVIYCFGAIIDALLLKKDIQAVKKKIIKWLKFVKDFKFKQTIVEANDYFIEMFDSFYGSNHFSKNTIVRSCITSVFTLGIVFVICRILNPDLMKKVKISQIGILIFFNLIVDYFSLIETRYILKFSKKIPYFYYPIILFIDLMLSLLMYGVLAVLGGVGVFAVIMAVFKAVMAVGAGVTAVVKAVGVVFAALAVLAVLASVGVMFLALVKAVGLEVIAVIKVIGTGVIGIVAGVVIFLSVLKADTLVNKLIEINMFTPFLYSTFLTSFLFHFFILSVLLISTISTFKIPIEKFLDRLSKVKNPVKALVITFGMLALFFEYLSKWISIK